MKSLLIKIENKFFKKNIYSTYNDALDVCLNKGYEDDELAKTVYLKTQLYKEGLLTDNDIRIDISERVNILASVIKDIGFHTRVLDFGGACGATYFTIKKLLGEKYKLDWGVIETARMCKYGKNLENGELKYFDEMQKANESKSEVDLINVSGSLQYVNQPYKSLNYILESNAKFILFSRMCFTLESKEIITVQKSMLSWHGYGKLPKGIKNREVKIPFTVIGKSKFDELLLKNYEYLRIFTDDSGLISIKNEPIFGLGLLCRHK